MSTTLRAYGFTVIELVVVIVVIGVLAGISVVGYSGLQQRSRNTERKADASAIAAAFENYRDQKGQYPNQAQVNTASFYDDIHLIQSAAIAPGSATNSIQWSTTPDIAHYGYTAKQADNSDCLTSSDTCVKFTLSYRDEQTNTVINQQSKYGW